MKKEINLIEVAERATSVKDIKKYLRHIFVSLRREGADYRVCDKLSYLLQERGICCMVYSESISDNEIVGVSKSGNIIRYCWNNYFLVVVYNEEVILQSYDGCDYSAEEAEEVFSEQYEY